MKEVFLEPKLSGTRFDAHSVPLEILKDFAALQEMLVEVAKWKYKVANPSRERIPHNFTEGLDLHLESVGEGSAVLKIALVFSGLFATGNNMVHFENARTEIVQAIASADKDITPTMPAHLLSYFDRFGRGLRDGESIAFKNGEDSAILTPEVRKRLIRSAHVDEWTDEISIRARIPEVDVKKNSFELELNDGSRVKASINDNYRDVVLGALNAYHNEAYVLVKGIVTMDRQNRPKVFESIEHITPLDPLDVSLRVDQLAELQDGWLDGKGIAPEKNKLFRLASLFDAYFDEDLPLPYLYPTPEGAVQAEWTLGSWEATLEIDLSRFDGAFHALNDSDHTDVEEVLPLNSQEGWIRLNEALKKIEGQVRAA